MKKMAVVVAIILAIGVLSTAVYAARQGWGPGGQVDVNAFRQFQKETLQLRDEAMAKRLELRNEYTKEKPDENRIASLRNEIISLRTQIREVAARQGLPAPGFGRGRGFGGGAGGCGGPGFGRGYCNGGGPAAQE